MSDTALLVLLIGFAVSVGGLCGWAASSWWSYCRELRDLRAEIFSEESSEWTTTDDDWLESHGIGYGDAQI